MGVTYAYDELNRLHTVTNWLSQTATYAYDPAGRLTSLTNFNGTVTTYGYDNANRLTSQNSPSIAAYQFTLDGNGNRTHVEQNEPLVPTITPATTSYTYNAQKNRLLSAGANNFTYDYEGQMNAGYNSFYSFDYEHRLTGIGSDQFFYDGSGNRLQAIRGGVTTRYIYGAGGNLLAEADGSNNITKYYIHGLGLLAMVTPSDLTYSYHYNAVGSTIAITNQSQNMINQYSYDPFGKILNQQETIPQPFKFVGQYGVMTEPTGFYYMRARYYDPGVGRFISEDPLGFDGGDENLYAYVGNNPVMDVDPEGQISIRGSLKNPKVTAVLSYGASKLAEYAATKMEPGKARAAVYAMSGALSVASAYSSIQVGVASYAVAFTTAQTVVGMVGGLVVGTAAFGLAAYDLKMSNQYFNNAYSDFTYNSKNKITQKGK